MAEQFINISPYHFAGNNPISFIDLNGMNYSPIYDQEANFLGTDDEGLQGKAIVIDKKNFEQGMSHKEAMDKSLGSQGLKDEQALAKLLTHYDGLKDRPDYDGFVTREEGIYWAKTHPNVKDNPSADDALYIDASKLDFGFLQSGDLQEGVSQTINLLDFVDLSSSRSRNTTYAFGNTPVRLINSQNGILALSNDDSYDLDYHQIGYNHDPKVPPSSKRDKLVWRERKLTGLNDSHGVPIRVYGVGRLRAPNPPIRYNGY